MFETGELGFQVGDFSPRILRGSFLSYLVAEGLRENSSVCPCISDTTGCSGLKHASRGHCRWHRRDVS